jgi:putative nucleotidyltransferase with HDIG domain
VRLARIQRLWLQRVIAVLVAVAGIPALVAVGTLADEAPVRLDEPAPRTISADEPIRVVDRAATEEARERAAQSAEAVQVFDDEVPGLVLGRIREFFGVVRDARRPVPSSRQVEPGEPAPAPTTPPPSDQLAAITEDVKFVSDDGLRELIALSDSQLAQVESETLQVAREIARLRIQEDELAATLERQIPLELSLRTFPGQLAENVVGPLVEQSMEATVTVDPQRTQDARDEAAAEVDEIAETWRVGETIVREGEIVTELQMRALEQVGLTGLDASMALLRSLVAMIAVTAVVAIYLRQMQPKVWRSGRKVLLLAVLTTAYTVIIVGIGFVTDVASVGWWFAVPAGAFAMLTAILVAPVVGIATMLPAVVLVELVAPAETALAVFAAGAVLVSVPLVTTIASRGDLRSATLRTAVAYPALAATLALVFGPRDQVVVAAVAGLVNGVLTAMLVQGLLPFLESSFRLPTVTALLDLADRNHPLLRELEQKALGSYNHSVMVASLVERACREIGANALLGSVAALYHDIGKVRQPHFFIENQQGIPNPHDDLEPEISAVIIQNHVVDGVEMAREHRLPPEVVAAIGSHHGTMLVTYFYRQALDRVGGDPDQVDVDHFRYKGTKPRSKEAAVLLMADCCEATTRSMAMERGTLSRDEIESTVDHLIQARIDDGQFDQCDLAFAEMSRVRDSIVEALVGIYHPRIAYPPQSPQRTVGEPQAQRA